MFDYGQVLVVHRDHRWAGQEEVQPEKLAEETLITYPVPLERLDIYQMFLLPAKVAPRQHKTIETTDIMLQMVASGRGVTALQKWLVTDYAPQLQLRTLRLGPAGIQKHIYLGARAADIDTDYLQAFIAMARRSGLAGQRAGMEDVELRIVDGGFQVQHAQHRMEHIVVRELLHAARLEAALAQRETVAVAVAHP